MARKGEGGEEGRDGGERKEGEGRERGERKKGGGREGGRG